MYWHAAVAVLATVPVVGSHSDICSGVAGPAWTSVPTFIVPPVFNTPDEDMVNEDAPASVPVPTAVAASANDSTAVPAIV